MVDGAHKLGAYYAGIVDFIPRLEGDLGWLLYAAAGNISTGSNIPENGVYTHIFRMDTSNSLALKWTTCRREIPAPEGGSASGTESLDTRLAGLMLNFAAAARLTARATTLGREPSFSDDVSSWEWVDTPEDLTSVPVAPSTGSYFKIPSYQAGALPSQLVRVTLGNTVTQPQQEFILGSPYPEDFVSLYRSMTIEADYKWEDEALYMQLVANGATGASIAWSPVVYEANFAVRIESPAYISGRGVPYSLEVAAPKVIWFPTNPPEIAGLNILRLPMRGIVARHASQDSWTITLINEVNGYAWPS